MGSGKLKSRSETYFKTVPSMCRSCRKIVPARVFFEQNNVFQQSLCPDCGCGRKTLIAADKEAYLTNYRRMTPDESPLPEAYPQKRGCPHDCGPCEAHASRCRLPVFSITNACNLNCRHCFTYNRKDKLYFMSEDEMASTLETMLKFSGGRVDLVNITGGEPTLHPNIFKLLDMCKRPEIGRITLNSNGIKLANDPKFCEELAKRNIYVVLSLNELDEQKLRFFHPEQETAKIMAKTKRQALANLKSAGVNVTLLNVLARDVNEGFANELLRLMLDNEHILNLNFQTLTYTGQGGGSLAGAMQIPADEAVDILVKHSDGRLRKSDFAPRRNAHFLCYQVCYCLKIKDELIPLRRFLTEAELEQFTTDGYLLHCGNGKAFFQNLIDRLYAENADDLCKVFRTMLDELFPSGGLSEMERQKRAEKFVRAIHIHAHMDEDNLDLSRLCACPDQVPTPDGKMISACAYNLFYRMRDENFYVKA